MVALNGSSLLDRGRSRGRLRRRVQILLDRVPAHVQVALDLADRPVLGPVQAMQVVDLFGGEHGSISFIRQKPIACQNDVLYKIRRWGLRRGGSASKTQTCAEAELLFARCSHPGPTSQTSAAECFRSRAELLFARSRKPPFLIPDLLLLAVTLDDGRVLLPVPLPVVGVAGSAISAELS